MNYMILFIIVYFHVVAIVMSMSLCYPHPIVQTYYETKHIAYQNLLKTSKIYYDWNSYFQMLNKKA